TLFLRVLRSPHSTLCPYTTLFRSGYGIRSPLYSKYVVALHRTVIAPTSPASHTPSRPCTSRSCPSAITAVIGVNVYADGQLRDRSEEHTSELQSRFDLVCRLLLEK